MLTDRQFLSLADTIFSQMLMLVASLHVLVSEIRQGVITGWTS